MNRSSVPWEREKEKEREEDEKRRRRDDESPLFSLPFFCSDKPGPAEASGPLSLPRNEASDGAGRFALGESSNKYAAAP